MRTNGRKNDELRKVKITRDYLKFAEGSCLIEIGNTKVVCSASVENGVPPFLRGKGQGWVTAEYGMLPRSCKSRIPRESSKGRPGGRTHEIQRLIGRSLRSVVDMTALGERTIWLDADVIQGDGGTRCASITGSFIALCDALLKLKKDEVINEIPIRDFVAAISVGCIDNEVLLDLDYNEDSNADVDMNIIMTGAGKFVEIQGTAEKEPFEDKIMHKMINTAKDGIKELIAHQKKLAGKAVSL
ncbi:MAG: ribonuclease PH [Candidatus Omnitrophota bacterium]|nr:ribonuclease PH [Candidatus Omnitrophota bacterium]